MPLTSTVNCCAIATPEASSTAVAEMVRTRMDPVMEKNLKWFHQERWSRYRVPVCGRPTSQSSIVQNNRSLLAEPALKFWAEVCSTCFRSAALRLGIFAPAKKLEKTS
jgi:hypothetical protein